jgi:tetratricopeptide (TPR) repeat protein
MFKWILVVITCLSFVFGFCTEQGFDKTVLQAYELRIDGKVDSAKVLLELLIVKDPTNAAAYFELARLHHYLGLGNPREIMASLEKMKENIELALNNDPDNVIYSFYNGYINYYDAFISMMMNQPDAKDKVSDVITAYDSVLRLKPDFYEAKLYQIEILTLPEEYGGNPEQAKKLAKELEETDEIYGVKARELVLLEEDDRIEFWQNVLDNYPNNAEVLEQFGKAYLYQENIELGRKYLEEAIKIDSGKDILILDLARYYIMSVMRDEKLKEINISAAEEMINKYLETKPVPPLQAYSYGLLAKIKNILGDNEGAEELIEKAASIDPFFSKASGIPPLILFEKPDKISNSHTYFFRPF